MIVTSITSTQAESMDLTEQLNQFFIEHEKKAYTIAFMALKNQDDALDVVQDVMIKFVEKYKHKNIAHWGPLFYRMVQNRITDFHRASTRRKKYFSFFNNDDDDENIIEQVADDKYVSALEQIDNDMQIAHLQLSIKELSARQLQAFICRIWEGLSVAQTAKSMKCSQGSVKTHLFRALKYIKQQARTPTATKANRKTNRENSNGQ
ncbi:RNA polymerase sigma-70 factor [hydrothermal vent metagenome]|uniref:RNA polymerase sigma-70 factor n=1 Tax=hydrothermal vent metagenome TaxID=652676 RepID=A0A3B0VEW6_9ZZZZ